jgi:hypothetical protein
VAGQFDSTKQIDTQHIPAKEHQTIERLDVRRAKPTAHWAA